MIEYYKNYWKHAFNFADRTSRAGYWVPWLITFAINTILSLLSTQLGIDDDFLIRAFENGISPVENIGALGITLLVIQIVWSLANLIPGLSILIRRLHDVDKGWLVILYSLIPLIVGIPLSLLFLSMFLLTIALLISCVGAIVIFVYTLQATKAPGFNRWFWRPQV